LNFTWELLQVQVHRFVRFCLCLWEGIKSKCYALPNAHFNQNILSGKPIRKLYNS